MAGKFRSSSAAAIMPVCWKITCRTAPGIVIHSAYDPRVPRRTIETRGALLIGKPDEFKPFFEAMNIDPATVKFEKVEYRYSSLWGKKRKRAYYLAIWQPTE